MSLLRLPYQGLDLETQQTITQFVIPAGAGATFVNANAATVGAGGVCTFTSNAAHGLTLAPAANVPPNYFVTFGGSVSASTGTGVMINNVFRVLSIPTTTTFTFWSTISTLTVTSTTVIPVFFPPYIAGFLSQWGGGPNQSTTGTQIFYSPPQLTGAFVNLRLGANINCVVDVLQTALILDPFSTPSTGTPATAPTWTTQVAASANGAVFLSAPWGALFASGTTATSTVSVVN
jgi:hypothetical protein